MTGYNYRLVLNQFGNPNELYLYNLMKQIAPEAELRKLLGAFKLPYVSYLISKIWEKRYVCLCPDMQTARSLYINSGTGSACFDSDAPDVSSENIARFNNGDTDHLFITGNWLPQLKDVEAVILTEVTAEIPSAMMKWIEQISAESLKIYAFTFHDTIEDVHGINLRNLFDLEDVEFHKYMKNDKELNQPVSHKDSA